MAVQRGRAVAFMLAEGTAQQMSSALLASRSNRQGKLRRRSRSVEVFSDREAADGGGVLQPQTSVARVACEHGINGNQLFTWRRPYRHGQLGTPARSASAAPLLPVRISDAEAAPARLPTSSPASSPIPSGTIQLQTERGRLQIEGAIDPESLRLILERLLSR